jgi:hypothetical protein
MKKAKAVSKDAIKKAMKKPSARHGLDNARRRRGR